MGTRVLNSNAIETWHVLGDFAYVKMLLTVILLNIHDEILQASGNLKVSHGPISHELRNIEFA